MKISMGCELLSTPERVEWARKYVYGYRAGHKLHDTLNEEASMHLLKAIAEGWGPEGETERTIQQWQEIALRRGHWRCPKCPDGWDHYLISRDARVCPACGYAGG